MEDNNILLKEKTVHGTTMHPFAEYHTDISELLPFYPIHWHEEMEIIRVQKGRGMFCIGGNWYQANTGDILILNPYVSHSINRYENDSMSIDAIVFDLNMLESSILDACTVKYIAPLHTANQTAPCIVKTTDPYYHPFDQSLTTILTLCNDKTLGYELAVKANLLWLFYHMYANKMIKIAKPSNVDKNSDSLKRVLEYITNNYMNEISVTALSKRFGYSEYYFMKLFKKYTGITLTEYVNNFRLNVAGKQLIDSDDAVVDIAYQVGFNNISYFNKQFKSVYNTTPKQFRIKERARQAKELMQ